MTSGGHHCDHESIEASLTATIPVERLANFLAPEMPSTVVAQLLAQPKTRARLSEIVISRLHLAPIQDVESVDLQFALIKADEMAEAIAAVGAIWHYNMLRHLITKAPLLGLIDAIGERAYSVGMSNADLAVASSAIPSVANLVCAIQRYGRSCVEAWLETIERPVAELTRLKLPRPPTEETEINDDHRGLGPAIVRRVGMRWMSKVS
jgi:hypothetical protein